MKKYSVPKNFHSSLGHNSLDNYQSLRESVFINKAKCLKMFEKYLTIPKRNQPNLCTYVDAKITSLDNRSILYKPRISLPGSVICHLGEAHLGSNAQGAILDLLTLSS